MIKVIDCGGGIWIAKTDIDMTNYAVVSSEKPEKISIYSKFDDELVMSRNADQVSVSLSVLHDRLLHFLKQKSR